MSNYLDSLLQRVEDPGLRSELTQQVEILRDTTRFGLVYEQHLPETIRLYKHPIRVGTTVQVETDSSTALWTVDEIRGNTAVIVTDEAGETIAEEVALTELVAVREFGRPIYPGLKSIERIERGADKPFHSVINAENYHALETLLYAYEQRVDCIYLDPPYNTGARDWKYNNDYVDGNDAYRHSKWLAMMERRLAYTRSLLNPEDSVLIVTIDEKEYLHLGLLLEQLFPEARIQMVSTVINPKGATRSAAFGRTDEYVYFLMFGNAAPLALSLSNEWKVVRDSRAERLRWAELLRAGTNARREDRPGLFYPVFLRDTQEGPVFDSVGDTHLGDRADVAPPEGCVAVWPIRSDGSEGNWQVGPNSLVQLIEHGHARIGTWREERSTISYLKRGERRKVQEGVFPVVGRRPDGSVIVDSSEYEPVFVPGTQWRITSHEAGGQGGTGLLRALIPGHRFPFPKSLYAVEDALRFFVGDKPDALVLDFFAGSGTTAHAVMRLNHEDGGNRQSLLVTNNEVSDEDARELAQRGVRPGDVEWESRGIFNDIIRPRLAAAITGHIASGIPLEGDYRGREEFPLAEGFQENIEFLELEYLDRDAVARGKAFRAIAPLLWMKAGAAGKRIDADNGSWSVPDESAYGVLFNTNAWGPFVETVRSRPDLRHVFVVTDSLSVYQQVVAELPTDLSSTMLYEDYLSNFEINTGGPR